MDYSDRLTKERFLRREQELFHPTYDEELAFYDLIKSGNVEELQKRGDDDWKMIELPERGELSKNHLQSVKYHVVVSIAMITRFCIEGGMDEKDAYHLSDLYINQTDIQKSVAAVIELQKEMAVSFAKRMKKLKIVDNHSVHCKRALDYIYDHLHENIHIQDVADYVGLNITYLSKLFLEETGKNMAAYIRQQKINEAKNLLSYTDSNCAEIAQYLAFASGSHFAQVFKTQTGMTPLQYRNRNYRKHWEKDDIG